MVGGHVAGAAREIAAPPGRVVGERGHDVGRRAECALVIFGSPPQAVPRGPELLAVGEGELDATAFAVVFVGHRAAERAHVDGGRDHPAEPVIGVGDPLTGAGEQGRGLEAAQIVGVADVQPPRRHGLERYPVEGVVVEREDLAVALPE